MGSLRLKQRIVQSNRLRFVPALGLFIPSLCLDAPGKIVCLFDGLLRRLGGGVFASGYGVGSAGRTGAESGAIVAQCDDLSLQISPAKRTPFVSTLRWSRRVQSRVVAGVVGPIDEATGESTSAPGCHTRP